MKKILILFLFISSIVFSKCPTGLAVVEAPAIVGDAKGGLLKIYVLVAEGDGNVYTSIDPYIGISTQQSAQNAVELAFKKSGHNLNECNVFYTIPSSARFIDGPSAGALFTCAVYSAITNQTMRDDIIITGSVNTRGSIGSVGGLDGKAKTASIYNKNYFITPIVSNKDYLLVSTINEKYGVTIVHVEDIDTLFNYVFSDEELPEVSYSLPHPNLNVEDLQTENINNFDTVVYGLGYEVLDEVDTISPNTSILSNIVGFMIDDIEYQNKLNEKGYKFTAANNLFLHYTDLLFVEYLTKYQNLKLYHSHINKTVQEFEPVTEKTDKNFESVVGGYMRYTWAKSKVEAVGDQIEAVGDEQYSLAYDLSYASAWLKVSLLLNTMDTSGETINENKVQKTAEKWILETEKILTRSPNPSSDAVWHYSLAKDNLDNKQYIAAVYESAFAQALQRANDGDDEDMGLILDVAEVYTPKGLWGKLYFGQGMYLLKNGNEEEAYKLMIMAVYFDNAYEDVYDTLQKEDIHFDELQTECDYSKINSFNNLMILVGVGLFIILIQSVAIIILSRQ
ncbi:hypothetical protein KO465_05610 [Candidatus Micrarchaeota archaeon]|nr:hypothetical protein [Candidatus Micrarchaeota archaeon]